MVLRSSMCLATALCAMVFLSSSASASPISAGTRPAPPEGGLFHKVQCQRVCDPPVCNRLSNGRRICRQPVCRVICNRQRPRFPTPGSIPRLVPPGPVGAPAR
jgi:hypothetical protein